MHLVHLKIKNVLGDGQALLFAIFERLPMLESLCFDLLDFPSYDEQTEVGARRIEVRRIKEFEICVLSTYKDGWQTNQ